MQFRELLFDELVISLLHRDVPIELALVVRIENAIIKAVAQSILFASGYKRGHNVSLVWARRNIVVIVRGIPQAKAGHVFRGQHGIARAQLTGDANPLANIEVRWIIRARGYATSFVIVASERVHAEVERHAELKAFKNTQPARGMGGRFNPAGRGGTNLRQQQTSRGSHRF